MPTNAKSPRIDKKQIALLDVAQICRFLNFAPYKDLRIRSLPEKIQKKSLLSMSFRSVGFWVSPRTNAYEFWVSRDWSNKKSLLAMSLRSVGFEFGPVQMPTSSKSPSIDETNRWPRCRSPCMGKGFPAMKGWLCVARLPPRVFCSGYPEKLFYCKIQSFISFCGTLPKSANEPTQLVFVLIHVALAWQRTKLRAQQQSMCCHLKL